MNILDIIIVVVTVVFMIKGYQAGLIKQVINLFGYVIAIFIAYKFYDDLAPYLEEIIPLPNFENSSFYMYSQFFQLNDMFYNAISFVIIFIGVKILLYFVLIILDQIAKLPGLAMINRSLGVLIGLVEALIIAILLVNFISIMPWENMQSYLNGSSIAITILDLTPSITEKIYGLWNI